MKDAQEIIYTKDSLGGEC